MPCWYYDKKALHSTPSLRNGIEPELEARYRREGARYIIETGTKMGLRYDTCATGVVYFHRFYMFHSFKEFHRYVTAACCLFLAGKVEETPKKCKDIIKITRATLTDSQFAAFGEDPKEEVMTLERVLLQTIKFDLQVEHPYSYLLKFSKMVKGDKNKIQKLVQMGWTFINDSLCTTLSLQWEADIIAVSLMYLASRLTKFDIQDWKDKPLGHKGKWWEYLVEDTSLELLEDVCHQVLDLYSSTPQKGDDSPPPPPPPPKQGAPTPTKHSRPSTPQELSRPSTQQAGPPAKMAKQDSDKVPPLGSVPSSSFSQHNPYVASHMYSSSFMSQEGSESIQSILGGRTTASYNYPAPNQPQYTTTSSTQFTTQQVYSQPQGAYSQPPPHGFPTTYASQQPSAYTHSQQYSYTQSSTPTQQQQQYPPYQTTPGSQGSQPHTPSYKQYAASPYNQGQQYSVPPPPPQPASTQYQYPSQPSQQPQQQQAQAAPPVYAARPPPPPASANPHRSSSKPSSGLPAVRITGRR